MPRLDESTSKPRGSRPGFTLLELLTALALSMLLLAGGRLLLEQLALTGDGFRAESARADEVANGARLLRALLSAAEAGSDTTRRFAGDELSMAFSTWCEAPAGWLERCAARLELASDPDSSVLIASLEPAGPLPVWTGRGAAHFRYYGSTGGSVGWVKNWGTSIALPLAIGIVRQPAGDTVVIPVRAAP